MSDFEGLGAPLNLMRSTPLDLNKAIEIARNRSADGLTAGASRR